ncbi:hypothetical protein Tco_0205705 [Tanacetum coccineum]
MKVSSETLNLVTFVEIQNPWFCRLCKLSPRCTFVVKGHVNHRRIRSSRKDPRQWKLSTFSKHIAQWTHGATSGANITAKKIFDSGFLLPTIYKDANELSRTVTRARKEKLHKRDEMPQNSIQVCEIFVHVGHRLYFGPIYPPRFRLLDGTSNNLVAVDYLSKWVEAKALPTMMPSSLQIFEISSSPDWCSCNHKRWISSKRQKTKQNDKTESWIGQRLTSLCKIKAIQGPKIPKSESNTDDIS